MDAETKFLNVDLDLRAKFPLDPLVAALEPFAFLLNPGVDAGFISLELNDQPQSVEQAIEGFARAVESLQPHFRKMWDDCEQRSFNVGIQSAAHPRAIAFELSKRHMSLIEKMAADIVFTVYGAEIAEIQGENT